MKDVRVRKARITVRLACGCWIRPGQYEVLAEKGPPEVWICRDCALARLGAGTDQDVAALTAGEGQ